MLQLLASGIVVDEILKRFEVWDSKHTMLEAARKGVQDTARVGALQ